MSIFGQVWLWSLLAFFVGVLLTWLVLVLPARKRNRELESALTAAHAESARTPANAGALAGGTALLSPVDTEDDFSAAEPAAAPSWAREQTPTELIHRAEPEPEPVDVESRLSGFEPEAEYEAEYRTAADPVASQTTVDDELTSERPHERESEPATRQIDGSVYRAAATEYLSPVSHSLEPDYPAGGYEADRLDEFADTGRGSFQEVGQRAGDSSHREEEDAFAGSSGRHLEAEGSHHAAETTSMFTRPEPEAEESFANRLEPAGEAPSPFGQLETRDTEAESSFGSLEPEAEAGSSFGQLEPQAEPESDSDFGAQPEAEDEPVSLFQPAKSTDPKPEPTWFERSAETTDRSPFEEPAGGGDFLDEQSSTEHLIPSAERAAEPSEHFGGDLVAGDEPIDSTQVLPKRQPREAPRGGFEPPRPIQPSMRPVERREPELAGTQSGSLFEPSVQPNQQGGAAPLNAPEPPPARQVTEDAVPPGPFGPGSAMPRPGGGRPSEGFAVKASVTALRYCTEESPQFPRMVAEVWFRTSADAERVGFRPLS
ncbi:hypothetical protein [Amycolatopsis saalfeldensis]|uniref:Uncharacterized protein n=1 Tax=Amycolatopsis saalfeldensis TaxID=394193 RepID=A0A1H8XPF7_9PSEU|nr:hypothetical protein [Amycolatopsis saalfeldensis]SEP41789.1 hypothetical protein SAMN04489732_108216 [Amycolatopsis saalfeldensis]